MHDICESILQCTPVYPGLHSHLLAASLYEPTDTAYLLLRVCSTQISSCHLKEEITFRVSSKRSDALKKRNTFTVKRDRYLRQM